MNSQVSPAHRFALHRRINTARALNPRDIVAGLENVASYWESFPSSYTPAQVDAARRLIVATPGTGEYDAALVAVANILRAQGSIISSDRVGR
jgi:hypothetical protein